VAGETGVPAAKVEISKISVMFMFNLGLRFRWTAA